MAIRATDDALVHLRLKTGYGEACRDQAANRAILRTANVIEIEHYRIGLAAIDAWMRQQIEDYIVAVAFFVG